MFAIVLLGLVAGCTAAPHYHHGHHPYLPERPHYWAPYFKPEEPIFDTRHFWADLNKEMQDLDNMLRELNKQFPVFSSQQGVHGNEYRVTIPLSGFKENEVVVKARKGVLMVQAIHKMEGGGQNSYLDVKTLPDCLNMAGSWTLEDGVLKIVFPLNSEGKDVVPQLPETTEGPKPEPITEVINQEHSREEMEPVTEDASSDADVGVSGDLNKVDVRANEIPKSSVEATTYAVDFKDEVEFVPVPY